MLRVALVLSSLLVFGASLPLAYADELEDVPVSNVCPSPLVKMAEEDLRAHCGSQEDGPEAFMHCEDKVLKYNLRVQAYNTFIAKCAAMNEDFDREHSQKAPEDAKRPVKSSTSGDTGISEPPAPKSSLSSRLKREEGNAETMRQSQKDFIDRAYNEQHNEVDKYKQDEADTKAQEERGRAAQEERDRATQQTVQKRTHCFGVGGDSDCTSTCQDYFESRYGDNWKFMEQCNLCIPTVNMYGNKCWTEN